MRLRTVMAAGTLALLTVADGAGGASATRWIVFAASAERGKLPTQVFRVSTRGTGLQQITSGVRAADEPSFSPDGRHVAFTRFSAGIFVETVDATGLRRLTRDPNDRFPVWSPDGRRVAFVHSSRGHRRLAIIRSDGRAQRTLRRGPDPTGRPSWMPSGRSLVVATSDGAFYEVSAATGAIRHRLRPTYDTQLGAPWWALSPNGRSIALVAHRPEPPGCTGLACEAFALYVGGVSSARLRRLVDDAGFPGWTSDSRRVVYATRGALGITAATGAASRTIALDSGDVVPVGDSPPAWQP